METSEFDKMPEKSPEGDGRTGFLTLLCVLTFIGSGFSAFSQFVIWAMLPQLKEMLAVGGFDSYFAVVPMARESMEQVLSCWRHYYLLLGFLYVVSLVGAVFMWRLRRNGFHIYTIAQCLVLIVGMVMNQGTGFAWGAFFWTALFVGLYATQLKSMRLGSE